MSLWWNVVYEHGELKVVALTKDGLSVEKSIRTALEPSRLKVDVDNNNMQNDSRDIAHIEYKVVDDRGELVPNANDNIVTHLIGPAKLLGTENGDPLDLTNAKSSVRKVFNGLGLSIIQSTFEPGDIQVIVGGILGTHMFENQTRVSVSLIHNNLRGNGVDKNLSIYYTLDGARATKDSKLYNEPFYIKQDSVVNVSVYEGDSLLFTMVDEFIIH